MHNDSAGVAVAVVVAVVVVVGVGVVVGVVVVVGVAVVVGVVVVMTNEERIELLRKVAEVAPEDLNAEFVLTSYEPRVYLESSPCKYASQPERIIASECDLHLVNDFNDAEAIIAMLDAMEKAYPKAYSRLGYYPSISNTPFACSFYFEDDDGTIVKSEDGYGSTRAEAVTRAFVKVFDKEAAE